MKNINRNSEFNNYLGLLSQDEITDELIDCFETFRKEDERQRKSIMRNEANITIENAEYKGLIFEPYASAEDLAIRNEEKNEIMMAISSLSKTEATRFVLNVVQGYSTWELAKMQGVYQTAVYNSIKAAKSKMKKVLKYF
jgi:DNA-directed RNA polymerase specialized sigma24 family protein